MRFAAIIQWCALTLFLCFAGVAFSGASSTFLPPVPTLTVSGNFSLCAGNGTTLQAGGADTYSWSSGQTSASISVSPNITTTYTVTGTYTSNSAVSTTVVTVRVYPFPELSLSNATICAGSSYTLWPGTPVDGTTYTWQPGDENTSFIIVSPATDKHYTITASANGCSSSASCALTVLTVTAPVTTFSYQQPICITDPLTYPALSSGFSAGGTFTASRDSLSLNSIDAGIDPTQSAPGTYTVTYAVSAGSCSSAGTGTALVNLVAPPVLTVSPDVTIGQGSGTVISVSGGSSYTWTPTIHLSCSDCSNPLASPTENTQYCVSSDNMGCSATLCIKVSVGCEFGDFSLPNAFSPNGDGFNDSYCLQGWNQCIQQFSVLIFDRWGEKVYESDNPSFCWDGSFKGKIIETDVLVYSVTASFTNGRSVSKKGNITLIR